MTSTKSREAKEATHLKWVIWGDWIIIKTLVVVLEPILSDGKIFQIASFL